VGDGIRVEQIDHVEVFVPDRREAARWYERVFGLEIMDGFEEWAANGGPLMVSSGGGTKLALFEGEPRGSRETVGFRRVAFRVGGEGFVEFLGKLPELGVESRVTDHDKAYSVYFPDPYGNDFEVTTYDHGYVSEHLRG
jgi:catechol 2,3-dioxygenase-like lactoylglutathione lyase family enzyme